MTAERKHVTYFESLIKQFQDDVLDEYNSGNISEKEMKNIIDWSRKAVEIKKNRDIRKTQRIYLEPDRPI